jgi:DNA-directed RNA polymerase specialized sigma24 family protein
LMSASASRTFTISSNSASTNIFLAIDHLRRSRTEKSFPAEPAGVPQPDPLVQRETQERIQQSFRRLPAKLQVAATLALVEELPTTKLPALWERPWVP